MQQLYTGFKLLHDAGLIELTQEMSSREKVATGSLPHLKNASHAYLRVEVIDAEQRKIRLFFDTHDAQEIAEKNLYGCDFYFKRSYSTQYIAQLPAKYRAKLYPLGLNYWVLPNSCDRLALQRNWLLFRSYKKKLAGIIAAIDCKNKIKFQPRLHNLAAFPDFSSPLQVLFVAAAYDPYNDPYRTQDKIDERMHNNEVRAACIRLLRRELGDQFYGGFIYNCYAQKHYRHLLIESPISGTKANYLARLTHYPICVATTGLHGSTGWKLAEYVAFAKAVVSEKLQYEVPGSFAPEQNYLQFSSPESCVEQVFRLLTEDRLREQVMLNNAHYYQHFVRPDMLVFNALAIAIRSLSAWAAYFATKPALPFEKHPRKFYKSADSRVRVR